MGYESLTSVGNGHKPVVHAFIAEQSESFSLNRVDYLEDYGVPAKYLLLTNFDGDQSVQVQLNDDPNATFTLYFGSTYEIPRNSIYVYSVAFANPVSGSNGINVEVLAGV